jgi:hypothetical protein
MADRTLLAIPVTMGKTGSDPASIYIHKKTEPIAENARKKRMNQDIGTQFYYFSVKT